MTPWSHEDRGLGVGLLFIADVPGGFLLRSLIPNLSKEHKNGNKLKKCFIGTYFVLSHSADDQRAHHARQGTNTVRNSHQNTGVTRSDVKMIDVETYRRHTRKNYYVEKAKEA